MVSSFFDAKTRGKIMPVAGLEEFQTFIHPSQLIREFGGQDNFVFDAEELVAEAQKEEAALP